MKSKKVVPVIWLVIYLLFIFYITLYNRNFSLVQSARLELFWSYNEWLDGKTGSGSQILLNIALFVPFGFFLSHMLRCWDVKRLRLWAALCRNRMWKARILLWLRTMAC
ncbi:MAG: VanZ family protein [Acidaminococcaceae bacterium]|nr:VanZ family protein [Acidaminococcaceae bacterium]